MRGRAGEGLLVRPRPEGLNTFVGARSALLLNFLTPLPDGDEPFSSKCLSSTVSGDSKARAGEGLLAPPRQEGLNTFVGARSALLLNLFTPRPGGDEPCLSKCLSSTVSGDSKAGAAPPGLRRVPAPTYPPACDGLNTSAAWNGRGPGVPQALPTCTRGDKPTGR